MKKKILHAILFSLFLVSCFAYDEIQWKTTKDLYNVPALSSGGHWSQEDIKQDTLLKASNKSGVFYNGYDIGFRDDFYVSAELENAEVCLPLDSVVNVTCKMQLPEALISGKTKPKYVDEITLQSFFSNRKQLIKQTYPNGVTNAEDEYFPWETLLEIHGGDLYLSNVYIELFDSFNFGLSKFFIKDMEMIDENTYKFECTCEDFYHLDSKYKVEKEARVMLYAEIDGDYIKVFLFNTENPFKTYVRINKETECELDSYFKTGLCDLSKVTWPRHADGTCDYEDENGIMTKPAVAPVTEHAKPTEFLPNPLETKDERKVNSAIKTSTEKENDDFVFPFIQVGFGIIFIIVLLPIILVIAKKRKTKKNG